MARLSEHGLRRVLGTSALFSTAYGNVGSSIYYALGLVASFALGLTPVVFIVTGFIFYLTAATYAEATTMYPEAGGSSSFARHAFNELWSFFAAWAQMLNYTITIAISAFFVPHYLGGLFSSSLLHSPGDVLFGIGVVALLSVVNVLGDNTSTIPMITSSSWVARSVTASTMFSPAASLTPTTLTIESRPTSPMPKSTSPGPCCRAGQNRPPM